MFFFSALSFSSAARSLESRASARALASCASSVARLAAAFPASQHVRSVGLRGRPDVDVWDYAAAHALIIVTKDDDFRQLSFLRGAPPKVVWLVVGNAPTANVARLLELNQAEIERFRTDADETLLVLRLRPVGPAWPARSSAI